MVKDASVSNSSDPLSGLNGPLLFPRTIRASANVRVPSDLKDLDSVHSFMKSLDVVRSPERLMNEAKKIVEGGAEYLESGLVGLTENVGITNAIAAKGKDKPQDRRPGLGLGRKRAPFSVKPKFSQPTANLVPTFDIDQLEDPDEFFDAFERNEYAKKEIQKQLGESIDNIDIENYVPSNRKRARRPSILGRTYNYKHRALSTPAKVDEMLMSSQETASQDIPSAHEDSSQENLVHTDPNIDVDLEEVEPASTKKAGNVNDMLEKLLSCNMEDLEGHGAYNLLTQQLKIKPLDTENLCVTERDVGRTASESWKIRRKSSVIIDSVMKSRKQHSEQENGSNSNNNVSSPTPPRNPFEAISLLNKKISQPNPMMDLFSPLNIHHSSHSNVSPSQHKDNIIGEVDDHQDMIMSHELESLTEFCNPEPPFFDEVMVNADSHPQQFADDSANIQRENTDITPNASPAYSKDKLLDQVDALKDIGMPSELEPHAEVGNTEPAVSNMDAQEVMVDADSLTKQSVEDNASIRKTDLRPNEESDSNIWKQMNVIDADESNPPVIEEGARVDASSRLQIHQEQPPEVPTSKPQKRKTVAGKKRIRNAHPVRKSLADESNPPVIEEEARVDASSGWQIDTEQPLEVPTAKPQRRKTVAGEKRIRNARPVRKNLAADESNPPVIEEEARVDPVIEEEARVYPVIEEEARVDSVIEEEADASSGRRQIDPEQPLEVPTAKPQSRKTVRGENWIRKAHPMRKSLAEAGTAFENGVRRSKRIRSRPLEFWKGERLVYGRVDNSIKLIGLKCFSPGECAEKLKVKPYISLEITKNKEILELAARY